jgi:hypothetical protein
MAWFAKVASKITIPCTHTCDHVSSAWAEMQIRAAALPSSALISNMARTPNLLR